MYKEIIGIKDASFQTENGEYRLGCRIYVATPLSDSEGQGVNVEDYYISNHSYREYHLGEIVALDLQKLSSGKTRCLGVLYMDDILKRAGQS